ncbi:hypothetical protein [Haloarcula pelagica]|nr:hypothetical protein [Halomicroarcula sp. YJ-61-S]
MSSPTSSTQTDDATVCWELSVDGERYCYATTPDESATALDMVILMFLDETKTDSWDDVGRFAAIARDYSTLGPREIAGILGIDLLRVVSAPDPSDPPWTFSDPRGGDVATLRTWTENNAC